MPAPSREEELGRGERGQGGPEGARAATGGASSGPSLIVWVVTRRIEHETIVLGVRGSEQAAAHLVDDDIESTDFPHKTVVRYSVDSHAVT